MAYVCGNRRGIGNHGELRSRKVVVNRLLAGGKWWSERNRERRGEGLHRAGKYSRVSQVMANSGWFIVVCAGAISGSY